MRKLVKVHWPLSGSYGIYPCWIVIARCAKWFNAMFMEWNVKWCQKTPCTNCSEGNDVTGPNVLGTNVQVQVSQVLIVPGTKCPCQFSVVLVQLSQIPNFQRDQMLIVKIFFFCLWAMGYGSIQGLMRVLITLIKLTWVETSWVG